MAKAKVKPKPGVERGPGLKDELDLIEGGSDYTQEELLEVLRAHSADLEEQLRRSKALAERYAREARNAKSQLPGTKTQGTGGIKPIKKPSGESRLLKAGTIVVMGNVSMTLRTDAYVTFPRCEDEASFVGALLTSSAPAVNFEANQPTLRFAYNQLTGARLPIDEQPEGVVASLTEAEKIEMGLTQTAIETVED